MYRRAPRVEDCQIQLQEVQCTGGGVASVQLSYPQEVQWGQV